MIVDIIVAFAAGVCVTILSNEYAEHRARKRENARRREQRRHRRARALGDRLHEKLMKVGAQAKALSELPTAPDNREGKEL